MARRKRIHGHRRKRSASSPAKFLGGAVGGAINMVKRLRDRKKGSAEANGRAEGSASGEIKGTSSTRMGGLAGMLGKKDRNQGLRSMVERVVDEKMGGETEKPKENDAKVLKTPKNDATTKELTTSTKDAAADEAVTRLYKQ